MDFGKLDSDAAYQLLVAINLLRHRLREHDHVTYSRELVEFSTRHGIDVCLLRAMVELTTTPIPLPMRES